MRNYEAAIVQSIIVLHAIFKTLIEVYDDIHSLYFDIYNWQDVVNSRLEHQMPTVELHASKYVHLGDIQIIYQCYAKSTQPHNLSPLKSLPPSICLQSSLSTVAPINMVTDLGLTHQFHHLLHLLHARHVHLDHLDRCVDRVPCTTRGPG